MGLGQVSSETKESKSKYNPKYTVFGYVRRLESLFRLSSTQLFQNIPATVTYLCISYYEPKEYFDMINNIDIKLSEDKTSIKKCRQRPNQSILRKYGYSLDNTSFGKLMIPSTSQFICKWYLKFNNIPKRLRLFCPFIIGVASVSESSSTDKAFNYKHNNYHKFYSYETASIASKILKSHNENDYVRDYGTNFKENDIICLKLDLKERQITFSKNDKSFGIAFDNIDIGEDIEYRLAVTIGHLHGDISILKFEERY